MPVTVILAKVANIVGKLFPLHILLVTLLGVYYLFNYNYLMYWLGDTKMCRADTAHLKTLFNKTLEEIKGCERGIKECVDVIGGEAKANPPDPKNYLQETAEKSCSAIKPIKVISLLLFLGLYYIYVVYKLYSLKGPVFGFFGFITMIFVWAVFGVYAGSSKKIREGCAQDMMEPYGGTVADANKKALRTFKGLSTTLIFLFSLTLLLSYYAVIFQNEK